MAVAYNRVDLTGAQEREWEKTRAALMWQCPAFTFILMSMMSKVGGKHIALFTRDVKTAATDGVSLIINPDYFFKFELSKRMFIVAHEIAHAMLHHMITLHQCKQWGKVKLPTGKDYPFEWQTMNEAMDLVINDMLVNCQNDANRPIFKIDPSWLHDTKIAKGGDSVIDVYGRIYTKKQRGGKVDGAGFDEHLPPGASQGKDPVQAAQDHSPAEWATAIAAAAQAAKIQGKLPGALESFIKEVLEPKVPWQDHIRGLLYRKIGADGYDWRRADRRLIVRDIYAPGRSGHGCGTVVVGADSSGSVNDSTIAMFFAELSGMLDELRPRRIVLIWCDAKVQRTDEIEEAEDLALARRKGAPGRGGTRFEPVFKEVEDMGIEPDALVYLTDGYGSFPPRAPRYPVIWGTVGGTSFPFGDVVEIPQ